VTAVGSDKLLALPGDKLKILVLNYEYPPIGGGGGRLCAQVSEALANRGHEVVVLTPGMRHLPPYEESGNLKLYRVGAWRQREDACSVPEMGFTTLRCLPAATRLFKKWRPDIIHCHFVVPTGILARILLMLHKIPYVLTAHLGDVPGGVPQQTDHLFKLALPLARNIWSKAAAVTAVSSHVADLAATAYHRQPEIVLNGIIPPQESVPRESGSNVLRLLMLGRLSIQKNPILILEALQLLPKEGWQLDIIGDGPLRGEVEELLASEHRLPVSLHGWLSPPRVKELLAQSDILVMPSLSEGLPMAAIEALWYGLAIVGSDIGGLDDVLEDGVNGLRCELSAKPFADAIQTLLSDRSRLASMKRHSLGLAKRFDLAKSVGQYEQILCRAVEQER